MDLNLQSLEEAIIKLSTMTDDRGILMHPQKMVLSQSMWKAAAKIMAETAIDPYEIEVDLSGDIES